MIWLFVQTLQFIFKLLIANLGIVLTALYQYHGLIFFTFPVVFYLYFKYTATGKQKFDKKDLYHFISYSFFLFFLVKLLIVDKNILDVLHKNSFNLITFLISSLSYMVIYAVLSVKQLYKYKKISESQYSNQNEYYNFRFQLGVCLYYYFSYLVYIILGLTMAENGIDIYLKYIFMINYTILICMIIFYEFSQSLYYSKKYFASLNLKSYRNSGLKNTSVGNYVDKIRLTMDNEKLWKNPDVNIDDISKLTNIPKHHITQVLNENIKKNFYTFVNEYRSNEVIDMFKNNKYSNWTILSIAYESGFNSKSSFNSFFKKYTGKTPSEYRREMLN
jgi:AraC-like DNA-binding protein